MADSAGNHAQIIRPEGALGVDRAASLRTELLAAFSSAGKVILALEAVSDMDLACLQVLYAARRSAREGSVDFSLRGSLPTRTLERLYATGFLRVRPGAGGGAAVPADMEALLVDFQAGSGE